LQEKPCRPAFGALTSLLAPLFFVSSTPPLPLVSPSVCRSSLRVTFFFSFFSCSFISFCPFLSRPLHPQAVSVKFFPFVLYLCFPPIPPPSYDITLRGFFFFYPQSDSPRFFCLCCLLSPLLPSTSTFTMILLPRFNYAIDEFRPLSQTYFHVFSISWDRVMGWRISSPMRGFLRFSFLCRASFFRPNDPHPPFFPLLSHAVRTEALDRFAGRIIQ